LTEKTGAWHEANQRYLVESLAVVKTVLEKHAAHAEEPVKSDDAEAAARKQLEGARSAMSTPPALEVVCRAFGLSPFERDVLLLCAGMELDSRFASLCAEAQGDSQRSYPTFSLALAALPGSHWSALTPASALRYWRLIEIGAGSSLVQSPLKIDERILHFLTGIQYLDERLMGIIRPVGFMDDPAPSHQDLAERIARAWSPASARSILPVIYLYGIGASSQRCVAASVCRSLGLQLLCVSAHAIPQTLTEIEELIRLWEREAYLNGCALLLECEDLEAGEPGKSGAISSLIDGSRTALIVSSRERMHPRERPSLAFEVPRIAAEEQKAIWMSTLGDNAARLNGSLDLLISQFSLDARMIGTASADALAHLDSDLAEQLWDSCRVQARQSLEGLAARIEPSACWEDLVLPEHQTAVLRGIASQVRQRFKVYDQWGFKSLGSSGFGISVLFAGASGTGKTLAAEVLANDLKLDLYRIDLSQVVSKYIGETEKNLRRVFDEAEEGGAVLLFDEADALFGKRSEVKDSHDRYANIEISYLLQRMESYRGLAILTSNMKSSLDPAFLRRIRFIVQFPFPDKAQRTAIWQRIFPGKMPTKGLDMEKLARLNLAGGNIRNIALNAAFLAAEAGEPVQMMHLLRSARAEYAKIEQPLTDAEVRGWV
jgi:hypothetical protein